MKHLAENIFVWNCFSTIPFRWFHIFRSPFMIKLNDLVYCTYEFELLRIWVPQKFYNNSYYYVLPAIYMAPIRKFNLFICPGGKTIESTIIESTIFKNKKHPMAIRERSIHAVSIYHCNVFWWITIAAYTLHRNHLIDILSSFTWRWSETQPNSVKTADNFNKVYDFSLYSCLQY